ncbi:MAG TPA: class I SAM-dependent methyltransferase [Anaerolineae bacterium]|nr:class I SAM-dependent methyltransferase [Anaerolineae bacterium]
MRKLLKYIAPKSFDDGLKHCNELGKKLIIHKNIERLLDVGCGDGKLTVEFADYAGARELYGIEFVDELRKQASQKGIHCRKHDLNGKWDAESDYFDLILSSQNIEHLHNTRHYLEECHRCLRYGGQLIVLTENLASWINIFALMCGWQPFSTTNINGWSIGNPFIWHSDEPRDEEFISTWQSTGVSGSVGHVRVLAYRGLQHLLEKVGFKHVKVYSRGYLPLWGKLSDILCHIDRRHGHFLIATGFK